MATTRQLTERVDLDEKSFKDPELLRACLLLMARPSQ
jgi:hypothetical protein